MQEPGSPFRDWRSLITLFTALAVVAVDLVTKEWVRTHPLNDVIAQAGFIRIVRIQNTGAAFGSFQGFAPVLAVIAALGILVILALAYWVYRRHPDLITVWNLVAVGLILGGTTGNLIDRLRFQGNVTDFIDVGFWPAFNAADSGISVGAVMIAISILRLALKERGKT
jgi:signal peptidase II